VSATSGSRTARAPLDAVMFHVFKARDPATEAMVALAVRSLRIHYPEARLVLLTNEVARRAELPPELELRLGDYDDTRLMLERVRAYRDTVRDAAPGTTLLFLDTDMLAIRRFDELMAPEIDLAVTVRNVPKMPINGGLIVARTEHHAAVVAFFDRLVACCEALSDDEMRWDGDQIALFRLLDPPPHPMLTLRTERRGDLTVRFAPARVYNQTPRPGFLRFCLFRPGARLLHFKGARKAEMPLYARRFLSRPYVAFARLTTPGA
jgi:hypothetical protein